MGSPRLIHYANLHTGPVLPYPRPWYYFEYFVVYSALLHLPLVGKDGLPFKDGSATRSEVLVFRKH